MAIHEERPWQALLSWLMTSSMSRSKDDIMAEIRQLQSEMAHHDESYAAGTKEN